MRKRATTVVVVTLLIASGGVWLALHRSPTIEPACTATDGGVTFTLDPEQAGNATTIAAEAQRQGLPDHAVSIGLAAALQESKLRNLSYGDRDSLGLFQQRPSQGWGSPEQLVRPSYAAAAFFRGLRRVHGWQALPIYEAAQLVQRSADGSAYASWESESRALARGLTGQTPAGFGCRFPSVPRATAATRAALLSDLDAALGPDALGSTLPAARRWLGASWLMAHAQAYSVDRIHLEGWTWAPRTGWRSDPRGGRQVSYSLRR